MPATQVSIPKRFLHGDTQATNIMVRGETPEYVAVLDWGSSVWGDSAWDFAGIPLRIVPFLLEGYRAVKPLDDDANAEARILWRQLQLALFLLLREPQPKRSWAERPTAMLMDITRFFLERPGARWEVLLP
jgi:Ser/Thr protein kinase RdoA (MazF antagonist)